MKKISNFGSLAVLMVVFAVSVFGLVASADHSWGGYHWARTSNPFTLQLGDNVSSVWDSYLATTSTDWSVSPVLDMTIVPGVTNPKNCRAVSGRVEVCNSKYGNNGWLGIASVWVNGSHITQATVKLNDTYYNTVKYNKPAWRNLVMCQEVGHAFGLDHQDEAFDNTNLGTCMDYTNDPDGTLYGQLNNEHPNFHDYEQVSIIYSHADVFNSFSSSLSVKNSNASEMANNMDTSNQSEWGKAIRASRGGQNSLYERNFGGGHKVFTFVVWAN
jgi:hypothetical protein